MSVFDTMERSELQDKVLSREIDSDCLLKVLLNRTIRTKMTI